MTKPKTPSPLPGLWRCGDAAMSYWLLLMSSAGNRDELEMAASLSRWHAMDAPLLSACRCLYFNESNGFTRVSEAVEAKDYPVLVYSSQADMAPALRIDTSLLRGLMEHRGGLEPLLTRVHQFKPDSKKSSVEEQVKDLLASQKTWKAWLGPGYRELKDLIPIGISILALAA